MKGNLEKREVGKEGRKHKSPEEGRHRQKYGNNVGKKAKRDEMNNRNNHNKNHL